MHGFTALVMAEIMHLALVKAFDPMLKHRRKRRRVRNKSHRIAEGLRLDRTSGVIQSNPLLQTAPLCAGPVQSVSPGMEVAQPPWAPVSAFVSLVEIVILNLSSWHCN